MMRVGRRTSFLSPGRLSSSARSPESSIFRRWGTVVPSLLFTRARACARGLRRSDASGEDEAVSFGIKSTAGVVTSAAIVMVAVFATLSWPFFNQFGVGLAAAMLIDATIVRAVLLPASMKLLGEWNWYLPSWLEWLPRLEGASESAPELDSAPASA